MIESLTNENADLRQTAAYSMGCLGQVGGPEFAKICTGKDFFLYFALNI